jgi:hypothetical protein
MYSNVPTSDLICDQQLIDGKVKHGLINLSKVVLEQNYFHFENNFYSQESGLAMRSPTSSVFSEIYLQYMENTEIFDILVHNNITGYFRYVDDILVVYDKNITAIIEVFDSFNKLIPTMKFAIEKEIENKINFLDITISKEQDKLTFDIYRKPTTTD